MKLHRSHIAWPQVFQITHEFVAYDVVFNCNFNPEAESLFKSSHRALTLSELSGQAIIIREWTVYLSTVHYGIHSHEVLSEVQ